MYLLQSKQVIKQLFFCSLLTMPFSFFCANIIFDMDGVLVTRAGSAWQIGPFKFIGNFNPLRIEDFVYDLLNAVESRTADTPLAYHKGRLLPKILCDYLAGTITSYEARTRIMMHLDRLAPGIDSQRKVKLVEAIINFIFTPELLAKTIVPIKNGVTLLKKCYRLKDLNGKRVHKIFIITNWDAESFNLLYNNKKVRKFLELVDGIVISGFVGKIKPSKEIYEYAFNYFGINPHDETTCYIDDHLCNIIAARQLGYRMLKCIHCSNFDYNAVDKSLSRIGIY